MSGKSNPALTCPPFPPESLWPAVVRGAQAISLLSPGLTWKDVSEIQNVGLTAQQTEALAAFSATFLVELKPIKREHIIFEKVFDQTFGPLGDQAHPSAVHVPRLLTCHHPVGGIAMCGCISVFGHSVKMASFTPIFRVIVHSASGEIDQFQVTRSILQASLDAQYSPRRKWIDAINVKKSQR